MIPQICSCGSKVDILNAHHFTACYEFRHFAHDTMVHEIKHMIRDVGVQVSIEVPAFSIFANCTDKNLRVDLFSFSSNGNSPIVGDVTIRDPHPPSLENTNPADAFAVARSDKERKYLKYCEEAQFNLQVYAFDLYGRMSDEIFSLINTLNKSDKENSSCSRKQEKYNWTCPTFRKYWRQRLSCCLQRSLAILVNKTMKQHSSSSFLFRGNWFKRNFSVSAS